MADAVATPATSRSQIATTHFHLWLRALNRTIAAAVRVRHERARRLRGDLTSTNGISPHHADLLVAEVEALVATGHARLPPIALDAREASVEERLLADASATQPLARLRCEADLDPFDVAALLIAAAPQIDTAYERLYGYLLDDLTRLAPSVELVLHLTRDGGLSEGARRLRLGAGGLLRRLGLLATADPLACEMRTVLQPAPGLVEWLLGGTACPPVPLADPQLLMSAAPIAGDACPPPQARRLLDAFDAVIGIWGSDPGRHDDAVIVLAAQAGFGVYRSLAAGREANWEVKLRREALAAAACNAVLWIDTRRLISAGLNGETLIGVLAALQQRIVLTGRTPWRPVALIGARPYADMWLTPEDSGDCWRETLGSLAPERAGPLSERFRFGWSERKAALRIATADVRSRTNGTVPDFGEALEQACRLVATPRVGASISVHAPRRTLRDLILPAGLHDQVSEIATLVAHAGRVDSAWGFGRLLGSEGSIKALFTGDPGTGKTLAAEAIAESAGLQLLKVDLSQVVSKWVGETEKNLEEVFDHAEQSHAALFFDEADALFGKRGEVRSGTDRYANLEVSYLLQRLEGFSGRLVILASNLRDEMDQAFTRRFQVSLHFPRPARAERERLWQLAFAAAPVEPGFDFARFAELDLTGGAIAIAARMAALLAAAEGSPHIRADHIADAIERQFRKEARLMAGGARYDGLSVARARC
ncbi:ATP-binding protein [Sphingomonas sp. S1-29]|uniref:ATP-binding protein n=1 Tax=Sphingomonas sp. S1-29 TaxID=2991074 RepID=UPI00223EEE91|nr:ATP-binding protein [Sphingomonas sp. S1-29]UZK70300.1 ATP-binding protein [Sphingomonas sp. S1-29]